MRRFELSEGTSNKFWEVDVEGAALTVRFGRIGTNGQTQEKIFPTAEKAAAEREKLVREKLKKGYAEVAGGSAPVAHRVTATATVTATVPAPVPVPAPARAGAIVWSEAALREVSPIRGSNVVPARAPDAKAAYAKLHKAVHGHDELLEKGAKKPGADAATMERVRAFFAGASPPDGELDLETQAAAYALVGPRLVWKDDEREEAFVRFWVATAGAEFAFRAVARAAERWIDFHPNDHLMLAQAGSQRAAATNFRTRPGDGWRGLRLAAVLASEDEHRALVDLAATIRKSTKPIVRAWLAVALERADWCREAAEHVDLRQDEAWEWLPKLALGVETVDEAKAILDRFSSPAYAAEPIRFDLVARFGAGAATLLTHILKAAAVSGVDRMRSIAEALALIVTREVAETFTASLDSKEIRAIAAEYLQSHPEVSLEPLAHAATQKGAGAEAAKAVLRPIVASQGELVAKIAPGLPHAAQSVLANLGEQTRAREEASEGELPRVLASPPWLGKRTATPPKIVTALPVLAFEESIAWKPGELESKRKNDHWAIDDEKEAKKTAATIRAGSRSTPIPSERSWNLTGGGMLGRLPRNELLPLLPELNLSRFNWSHWGIVDVLLGRHGIDVLDFALRFAREIDAVAGVETLVRVRSPRVAPLMADALVRLKKAKALALEWLVSFPDAAAVGLVPIAIGPTGKARDAAEAALRAIASRGHRAVIEQTAKRLGAEAEAAIRDVLDFDPLLAFPNKLPKLPAFWNAAALTRPLLASGKALPLTAVDALGTMLAFSSLEDPYPGIADVKEACEPRSLENFAWDLFQAWLVAGAPSKEQWAFLALAHFGGDEEARKLTPLVRAWPGEAAHARAVVGLDVLARIGTDVALMHLHGIAQKLKFKGLQEKAREKIDQIAEARGLTADELADRLVPDLGLDEDGSLALDFGPRSFRVVFDETLKPAVLDEAGKRLPDLPKPKQTDDAEKAKSATDTWKALKKDAKTIAAGQILRLEIAMCTQRRWTDEVFRRFLLEHPLLVHVVRRLVWGVYGDEGEIVATFRVTEDRGVSDVRDDPYELPSGARVGIVHRLELDDAQAAAWGQVLGDYEILQPFSQLAREIAMPSAEEKSAKKLDRVAGLAVPTGKVLGLDHRGWRRGPPQDAGIVMWYEKPLGGELVASLDLEPGIYTGMISESPEQKLGSVTIAKGYSWRPEEQLPLGALSPIAFSELLRDLESLRA